MEILGVGTPLLDYVVQVSDQFLEGIGQKGGMEEVSLPAFEKMLKDLPETPATCPGGSCVNTIKALQALGNSCKQIGTVGTDDVGIRLRNELKKRGIDERLTPVEGQTGQLISYVTRGGERTFRNFFGVSRRMADLKIDPHLFDGIDLVHLDGYTVLYPGLCERVMKAAAEKDCLVSFDLGSWTVVKAKKEELRGLLAKYVDIIFANDMEAKALTGKEPLGACVELAELCQTAVVTLGKEGCWVGDKDGSYRFPAVPAQVVDSTGAGDLFSAGFLDAYLKKRSPRECAKAGALLATEVIQIFGADLPAERIKSLGL